MSSFAEKFGREPVTHTVSRLHNGGRSNVFISLKLSMCARSLTPHQIVSDVITPVLCPALGRVFTGYCNICRACNTVNLSSAVRRCTFESWPALCRWTTYFFICAPTGEGDDRFP